MAEDTIAYREKGDSPGFTSRYSFIPEMIAAMNNTLYSFKGGNLWVHDTNETRNNFYGEQFTSKITTVFNDAPTQNKLFKTLNINGTHPWDIDALTDIQSTGVIDNEWFEKKEAEWFAFMRNTGTTPLSAEEFANRSVNGLGQSSSVAVSTGVTEINFSISPLVKIDDILSIGDTIYFALPPYTSPLLGGVVAAVNIDYAGGINQLVIDTTASGTVPISIPDAYFFYSKDAVSESHGVLGHFCEVTMENDSTENVEVFTIEAEVMKSYS